MPRKQECLDAHLVGDDYRRSRACKRHDCLDANLLTRALLSSFASERIAIMNERATRVARRSARDWLWTASKPAARVASLTAVGVVFVLSGCGANESTGSDAGASAAGGRSGSSGASGIGGASGTGGANGTGGASGIGGAGGVGGASGTGGSGADGSGGSGGTGTGGSSAGTGGAASGGTGNVGAGGSGAVSAIDELVRVNQIQNEGTHNSYHVATVPLIPDWQYTHLPLDQQLETQGVRHFELDVHYAASGFLVHHVAPDLGTTCQTWIQCLGTIKTWSDAHAGHHLLFIVIEPKDELDVEKIAGHYAQLESEALSVWPRERVMTPDDVRGSHSTLREAVTTDGWPTLGATRNKIAFFLMGGEADYIDDPALAGNLMFVRADEGDAHAAILKLEDPVPDEDSIRKAVQDGFIVRTRYNGGKLAYEQDVIDAALRGGAHLVGGDFPKD
jgi:hypothetical protein